jgi:hypothetical protein
VRSLSRVPWEAFVLHESNKRGRFATRRRTRCVRKSIGLKKVLCQSAEPCRQRASLLKQEIQTRRMLQRHKVIRKVEIGTTDLRNTHQGRMHGQEEIHFCPQCSHTHLHCNCTRTARRRVAERSEWEYFLQSSSLSMFRGMIRFVTLGREDTNPAGSRICIHMLHTSTRTRAQTQAYAHTCTQKHP